MKKPPVKWTACALALAGLSLTASAQVDLNTNINFNVGTGIYSYSYAVLNQGPTFDLAIVNLNIATTSNPLALTAPVGFAINFDPGVGIVSFFEDADPFTPQTFAPNSTTAPFTFTSTQAPVPIVFDALDINGTTFTGFTLSAAPDSSVVNNAVITGILSGNFTLTKTTAATLTLTGLNTYTGGTTLNAGILSFANGSLGTVGTVDFAGNATLQFFGKNTQDISSRVKIENGVTATFDTNGNNVIFASPLQTGLGSTGGLTKTGLGSLNLTAANTYTGTTTVEAGSLFVNGSIASANTLVNALGLLGGSGTIGGNVVNKGNVSPGNSPGTLTVKGNYTQAKSGTLTTEFAGKGAGQHDLLAVGGKASLDGTVRLLNVGSVRLKKGDKIPFLTAAGGVSGKFSKVSADSFAPGGRLLRAGVVYGTNEVDLALVQGSFNRDLGDLTPNQRAVARELDNIVGSSRAAKLIDFLDTEALGKLPADLDKIAPEELASIFNIGVSLANVQNSNLQQRMSDLQAGAAGFSASGYAMSGGSPSYGGETSGRTSYGARGPEGKGGKELRTPEENRWGLFVTGVGEFTNVGDTRNASGFDLRTGGFTLGVDYKVTPNFVIGLDAGYARTSADLTGNGRITVDGAKVGIYATYFTGTGFYVDAAANGGYNNYETRRSALRGTARGDTRGGEFNGLLATGYDWKTNGFSIGPIASVQYTNVSFDSFRERGSLAPLRVAKQNEASLRTAVGLKASYDWRIGGVIVRPEARAAWQHEFDTSSYALDSRLANGTGNNFTVRGPDIGDDSLLLGGGVAVLWNERTATYVYYDGEVARTNYNSHNISGGVRVAF